MTVRVVLSPDVRTLTDSEIEAYRQGLIASLKSRLDVNVRGE